MTKKKMPQEKKKTCYTECEQLLHLGQLHHQAKLAVWRETYLQAAYYTQQQVHNKHVPKHPPYNHLVITWGNATNSLPSESCHRSRMNHNNKNPIYRLPTWRKAIVKAHSALNRHRARIAMARMPSGIVRAPISDALPPFAKHKNAHKHTHNSLSLSLSLSLLSSTKLYTIPYKLAVIFFVAKTRHFGSFFSFFLKSKARWSRELFGKFPKNLATISKIFFLKFPTFLEDLGRFLVFFFWNRHI